MKKVVIESKRGECVSFSYDYVLCSRREVLEAAIRRASNPLDAGAYLVPLEEMKFKITEDIQCDGHWVLQTRLIEYSELLKLFY